MKKIVTKLNDIKETDWNLRGIPGNHCVTHVWDYIDYNAHVPLRFVGSTLTIDMLEEINLLRKKALEDIHLAIGVYLAELDKLGMYIYYYECGLTKYYTIDDGEECYTITFLITPFAVDWWNWANAVISLPIRFNTPAGDVIKMDISNFTDDMLTIVANTFFRETVTVTTSKKDILIETEKPGVIIGKKGSNINRFKDMLKEHSRSLGNKRIEVVGVEYVR